MEAAGFAVVVRSFGFRLPLAELTIPERLERLTAHVARRSSMRLRPMNLARLRSELDVVRTIYNHTLERNTGFVPISRADLETSADALRAIADPAMLLVAERAGQPAGVALSLPNINELLIKLKRVPMPLRLPCLVLLIKTQRIQTARQVIYGILPECRDRGLHAWLLREQFAEAKARYVSAELGWIEDNNTEILENSVMVGGIQHRRWHTYQRPL